MSLPIAQEGYTFDDVLLMPRMSDLLPDEASVATLFSRRVPIQLPIVGAAMDTVTESALAIALAELGGIGIIHRNMTEEQQADEVTRVKRSENGIVADPVTLRPDDPVEKACETMEIRALSGIPVVDAEDQLVGILTKRDLRFQHPAGTPISQIMTRPPLVTAPANTSPEIARDILMRRKVEKLLLVEDGRLAGLITMRDIDRFETYPHASRDERGRLRVGAAVGVSPGDDSRARKLLAAGVDVLVIDTAHGHSRNVVESVKRYRELSDGKVDVVAGNVATIEGAQALVAAGCDGVKVGIGPGSICTTRVISGVGVPQMTAIAETASVCRAAGVPLIADGGIKQSGDLAKALAAGADSVMLGSLLAGADETPGQIVHYQGRAYKEYRGMGSLGAMMAGMSSKQRYRQGTRAPDDLVPEGVEARVPYKGPLAATLKYLVGGLKSGMGYTGSGTLEALRRNARFMRISQASLAESRPHSVAITKESPNYSPDRI